MDMTQEYQERFVSQLKTIFPPHINLAAELSDLIGVSTDAIYRRLRGQSQFSFEEVAQIAEKYTISLDGIIRQESRQVSFNFNPMYDSDNGFERYFNWFSEYLHELERLQGVEIIYAAEDVPVFRHFKYPVLSAFKSFYWKKAVLNLTELKGTKFRTDQISPAFIELNQQTFARYSSIRSVEIWTEETLSSTLKQVEYYWESDLFEAKEDALMTIGQIRSMMDDLRRDCEMSKKEDGSPKADFRMYLSDVMIGNNCVLIGYNDDSHPDRAFLGHNTFNSISTHNASFTRETRLWIDNLIRKSILLSGVAEKHRARFFNKMDSVIGHLEDKIKNS